MPAIFFKRDSNEKPVERSHYFFLLKICRLTSVFLSFLFQLKSIIDARRLYLQWFPLQHPGTEVQFPLKEMDIKAFSVCLCRAGFTFSRIINNIYRGLCMWVSVHLSNKSSGINNSYQSTRSVKSTL